MSSKPFFHTRKAGPSSADRRNRYPAVYIHRPNLVAVVLGVEARAETDVPHVGQTHHLLARTPRRAKRRQQNGNEQGNHRDHNQQLDQRECVTELSATRAVVRWGWRTTCDQTQRESLAEVWSSVARRTRDSTQGRRDSRWRVIGKNVQVEDAWYDH